MNLVFISTGTPSMARDFQESMGLTSPIWVDKLRESYRHLGFKRGVAATLFNWKSLKHMIRSWKKGHRQGAALGDPWQQGGVLVVAQGGKALYGFAAQEAGDHPPMEEVLSATFSHIGR